ncbi:MAG: hypothetical protein ACRD12_21445 [Acidimicrobiales bacterium]
MWAAALKGWGRSADTSEVMLLIQAATCVLVCGFVLAGGMWARPHIQQWRTIRRFRKRLHQVDLVVMIWEQSAGKGERAPERRTETRRPRRRYDNPA